MQSPHKNENLLFKDFQDFLVHSQPLPPQKFPFTFDSLTAEKESAHFALKASEFEESTR
jgi:hypothetical protein